jgi:hypothetical protein
MWIASSGPKLEAEVVDQLPVHEEAHVRAHALLLIDDAEPEAAILAVEVLEPLDHGPAHGIGPVRLRVREQGRRTVSIEPTGRYHYLCADRLFSPRNRSSIREGGRPASRQEALSPEPHDAIACPSRSETISACFDDLGERPGPRRSGARRRV